MEAEKRFGFTKPRFQRALDELIKFGFIDINHHGGGLNHDYSTYFVSERWKLYGTQEFKKKTRPKDTRQLGFASKNWKQKTLKKRQQKKTGNTNVTLAGNDNVTVSKKIKDALSNSFVT